MPGQSFKTYMMDLNKFKKEEEVRYALLAIDILSKCAYLHPMMNRSSEDALEASNKKHSKSWGNQ